MSTTGCPISKVPLCFACFLGFPCSYRGSFYHFSTAQETRIPKLTLLSSLRQKLIKLQSKTWGKLDTDIIFWYIQSLSKLYLNPICLTFCSVTWSIFDVGRKVRWVLESTSPGLLKNGKMNVCTSTGSRENKQNKVRTQLWDTLYITLREFMQLYPINGTKSERASEIYLPLHERTRKHSFNGYINFWCGE